MQLFHRFFQSRSGPFGLATLLILSTVSAHAATQPLSITKAAYNGKTQTLNITAKVTGTSGELTVLHGSGGILASRNVNAGQQSFAIPLEQNVEKPCAVEVRLGNLAVSKAVSGAPAICTKAPECKILLPKSTLNVQANSPVTFKGAAKLKDPKAKPLKLEWDFAGGVMGEAIPNTNPVAYKRPNTANTTVQFVRDNASYRVRFTAWDKLNHYCESSVMVNVGTPPTNLPNVSTLVNAAQKSSAKLGSQLAGNKNEIVVLPFAEMTMPGTGDYRYTPNSEVLLANGAFSTLNASAYRKDRLPVLLDDSQVVMKYSAASNPVDPVGKDSINSTSQNWPLNSNIDKAAPLLDAAVQKTDMWEIFERPASDLKAPSYSSKNWATKNSVNTSRVLGPDEGFVLSSNPESSKVDSNGRYMPGRGNPYAANNRQDFTSYWQTEQKHIARALPLTDIDDAGRVNPYPLLRVEATDKSTGQVIASTDSVVGTAKDMHCRECHAKGKIAANDKFDWSSIPNAYHSSKFYGNRGSCYYAAPYCSRTFTPPMFYEAVDSLNQPSNNLFDQELAANRNIGSLHDFYDNTGENAMNNGNPLADGTGYTWNSSRNCMGCHRSRIDGQFYDADFFLAIDFPNWRGAGQPTDSNSTQSQVIHNFHEQLQLDPKDSTKILRDTTGRPKLWDPASGTNNTNTLFPTVDAHGNALPMEQNCLRCHGGHREPLFRDRMYTAGVTCYDCHGDMGAVGSAHAKPKPGPEGKTVRLGWFDQPDCGSCHTGNANQGKDGKNGFFSAGIMKRAFDEKDRSATTRTPVTQRFAVQEGNPVKLPAIDVHIIERLIVEGKAPSDRSRSYYKMTLKPKLFRQSRDTHGNVDCASCHGGAHENWPNRDPKSNDNVTAMQLQGHTGPILECNVCHTADSFKNEADLDGGQYSGDAKTGILGGPHNTHPINDPYWWKSTDGDSANADGTTYGGWHNNYAKKSGAEGEDQCAACHGNDHKGTRLSKTPVDRVFDFSSFNQTKLEKAGFKAKIIKVAAGTEISCNTCHSIETSCISSPAGSQCGVASNFVPVKVNHDPVITSKPVTDAVIGESYSYQVKATDTDGDRLTFSLGTRPNKPDTMTIDQNGLLTYNWPQQLLADYSPYGSFSFPYTTVTVSDGKGGYATQNITVNLRCPTGQSWSSKGFGSGQCVAYAVGGVSISSSSGTQGLNAGQSYSYQVTGTSTGNLPLTYSLSGQPTGMTINASGLITWQTTASASSAVSFQVSAADGQGGKAIQAVSVNVCVTPQSWDSSMSMCM